MKTTLTWHGVDAWRRRLSVGRARRHGHARRRFCHRRHGHPGQAWWGWEWDHGRKRDVIHDQRVITVVKRTEIASYAKSFLCHKKALKPLKSTISQQQKHKAWRFSKALWRLSLKQAFHTNTRQGGWTSGHSSVEFAPCKQCCMDRHVSFQSMCQISACLIRSGLIKLTIHPSGIPVDLLLPLPAVWKIPSLQKDRVVNINTAGLTPLPEGHAVRLQHHSH